MAGSTPVTATKLTVLPEREPCTVGDAGGDCGALGARGDGDAGNGAGGGNTGGGGGRGEVLGGGGGMAGKSEGAPGGKPGG